MKILLGLFLLFAFAVNSFALPVVFKTTKEIKVSGENEFAELATVDVSKYKNIRVGVSFSGSFKRQGSLVKIEAADESESIHLGNIALSDYYKSGSFALDILPNKIRISAEASGTYKIFVWRPKFLQNECRVSSVFVSIEFRDISKIKKPSALINRRLPLFDNLIAILKQKQSTIIRVDCKNRLYLKM